VTTDRWWHGPCFVCGGTRYQCPDGDGHFDGCPFHTHVHVWHRTGDYIATSPPKYGVHCTCGAIAFEDDTSRIINTIPRCNRCLPGIRIPAVADMVHRMIDFASRTDLK
jgi:hypothetical protein